MHASVNTHRPHQPSAVSNPLGIRRWLTISVLVLAWPLLVALWVFAAQSFGAPALWMAVIAVADASLLLGLLRWPPGWPRVALALGFLLACLLPSLWIAAAGVLGPAFGLAPWESALRMGPVLFEIIATPWLTFGNLVWLATAVALGVWWNR